MQPQRAVRGIAAIALSSAGTGILLVVLALVLTACGSSSAADPTAVSSATTPTTAPTTASTTDPAPTTASATATGSGPAAASSSGAAPGGDPADSTVPSVPVTTAPAVPLAAPAPIPGGGAITIGAITGIQGTAQLPGEIAGPAVRVPVTMRNGSTAPIDLNQVVVDLVDRAGASAGQLTADPAQPFTGTLAPGSTAQAVYVFTLATADRAGVSIVVSYTTAAPVVVFTGSIA